MPTENAVVTIQDSPGPQDADTSVAPAPLPPDPAPTRAIWLIIEQSVGGSETIRWGIEGPQQLPIGITWAQARQHAERVARTFSPRHPMMESSRTVLRLSQDSFLTIVPGATSTFHFRVSLAEPI